VDFSIVTQSLYYNKSSFPILLKEHHFFVIILSYYYEVTYMIIKTSRLILRPADISYLNSTHAYAGDPENTKFMMFLPYADLDETAEFLRDAEAEWNQEKPDRYEFVILLGDTHIGGITLYMMEDRSEAELGWVLHRDHLRKGYATEAARAVMEFARDDLGVRRIFAGCDSENVASYKLMEKLGMTHSFTGTRTNRSTGDEVRTELVYEIFL